MGATKLAKSTLNNSVERSWLSGTPPGYTYELRAGSVIMQATRRIPTMQWTETHMVLSHVQNRWSAGAEIDTK